MDKLLEKRLVKRLKSRDPRAFETLVERYQEAVLNFVYRMIGNRLEAEDLAQEVFIAIFKKIDGFRGDASLQTWIYCIASNHVKNRQKYLGRRPFDKPSPGIGPERASPDDSGSVMPERPSRPDELVEGYQMERCIQRALGELEEDQRLILVLRDIQNETYESIVEVTGLTPGTVRSRLHRARLALREKLDTFTR